jgi:hypothetical protein
MLNASMPARDHTPKSWSDRHVSSPRASDDRRRIHVDSG